LGSIQGRIQARNRDSIREGKSPERSDAPW